jgi:hypothetical protein
MIKEREVERWTTMLPFIITWKTSFHFVFLLIFITLERTICPDLTYLVHNRDNVNFLKYVHYYLYQKIYSFQKKLKHTVTYFFILNCKVVL